MESQRAISNQRYRGGEEAERISLAHLHSRRRGVERLEEGGFAQLDLPAEAPSESPTTCTGGMSRAVLIREMRGRSGSTAEDRNG